MGKKAPKAPATPDPVDAIDAQARVNRVDTVTPYGSTRYISNRPLATGTSAGKNGGGLNGGYGLYGIPAPSSGSYGAPINLGNGAYTAGDVRLSPVEGNGQFVGVSPQTYADPYSAADYSQVTQLSPELQAVFNNAIGRSLNNSQVPFEQRLLPTERFNVNLASPGAQGADIPRPTAGTFANGALDTGRYEDALFKRQTRLLEPQLQQREGRLRQNLADRGLVEGSEAYTEALNMEMDQANRLRQDAALSSVLAGQDVAERDRAFDFGVFTDNRNFGQDAFQQDRLMGLQEDTLNQQAFQADRDLARTLNNDDFARRFDLDNADRNYFLQRQQLGVQSDQAKFQQLASLLGLSPAQPITPIDVQGAINNSTDAAFASYNGKLSNYNQQQQRMASDAQTAATITTIAMMMASDRRLKTNIQRIGETDQGHNLYSWDWKDGSGSSVGVMADEMPASRLHMRADGYLMVNYAGITW